MEIEEVIRRIREGDSNAFEPIIHAYQQKLFTYCFYMLGNYQEAEDTVQEVFVKAYQGLDLYRFNQSFSAWLYKIAQNQCLTLLKRRKKWGTLLPKLWYQESQRNNGEEETSLGIESNLPELLKQLTVEERHIIILHVIEGYTLAEIAESLHVKAGTIRKRLERIRKKLKDTSTQRKEFLYEQTGRI